MIQDWGNWEVQYDENGEPVLMPSDNPFAGGPEPAWDPCLSDGSDDPELDRAKRARIVGN